MSKDAFFVKIPKQRAELPAVLVLLVIFLVGFAFHYDFFLVGRVDSFIRVLPCLY